MKRLLCDVLHSSLFYQTLEFIFIPEHVVSALRNISKRIIPWRCHRSVIFSIKEIIDMQEHLVLCAWSIGNIQICVKCRFYSGLAIILGIVSISQIVRR